MSETIQKLIASRHICCIHKKASVQDAAKSMLQGDCSSLIVTDDNNQVVGIVTERDFTRRVVAEGKMTAEISDICTEKLETVTPHTSISEALKLMHKHKVRHLPVIESGKVIGIISIRDLFDAVENRLQSEIREIRNFAFADPYGNLKD